MSIKYSLLLLYISAAYVYLLEEVKASGEKDPSTIEEFGEKIGARIPNDSPEKRKLFKEILRDGMSSAKAAGISTGEMKQKGKSFEFYFRCAIDMMKTDCENVFKLFTGSFEPWVANALTDPLPNCIEKLEIYDDWMYSGVKIPEELNDFHTTHTAAASKVKEDELLKYYHQWLYMLRNGVRLPIVRDLQYELTLLCSRLPKMYPTVDLAYQRFAGHMARSFIMACELHHTRSGSIIQAYGLRFRNKKFVDILFRIIPTWYFDQEQFLLLRILRTTLYAGARYHSSDQNHENPSYMYQKVDGYTNAYSNLVVIPYATECSCMDFNEALKLTTPISDKQFDILPQIKLVAPP